MIIPAIFMPKACELNIFCDVFVSCILHATLLMNWQQSAPHALLSTLCGVICLPAIQSNIKEPTFSTPSTNLDANLMPAHIWCDHGVGALIWPSHEVCVHQINACVKLASSWRMFVRFVVTKVIKHI